MKISTIPALFIIIYLILFNSCCDTTCPADELTNDNLPDSLGAWKGEFTDPGFEAEMQERFLEFNNNTQNYIYRPITLEELESLYNLWTAYYDDHSGDIPIKTLHDIQYCKNLEIVSFNNEQIANFTPLKNLEFLNSVSVSNNLYSNISTIASLDQINILEITDSELDDLSPLENLSNIRYLNLFSNNISDLTGIQNLQRLTHLVLSFNKLQDIGAIENLSNLTYLELANNEIHDFAPLENCKFLQELNLQWNKIEDISALPAIDNLHWFYIDNNNIKKLEFDNSQNGIYWLSAAFNNIEEINTKNLPRLGALDVSYNNITQLTDFEYPLNIHNLIVHHNELENINIISEFTNLSYLDFSRNNITSFPPISELYNIGEINAKKNKINDISSLENTNEWLNWMWADLSNNEITDIKPLVDNPYLDENFGFDLRYNPLSETSINEYIPILEGRGVTILYKDLQKIPKQFQERLDIQIQLREEKAHKVIEFEEITK